MLTGTRGALVQFGRSQFRTRGGAFGFAAVQKERLKMTAAIALKMRFIAFPANT